MTDLHRVGDLFENVGACGRAGRCGIGRRGEGAARSLVLGDVSVFYQAVDVSDFDVELIGAESLAPEDLKAGGVELGVEGALALGDQVDDLGALTRLTLHEDCGGVVVAHAVDVLLRDWECVQVLGGTSPRVLRAITNLAVHLLTKLVKFPRVRRRCASHRPEESVKEATFLRVRAQVLDLLHAQLLLLFPEVFHLWGVVVAHAEKLRKWVNVVCQAFLPIVVVNFFLGDAVGKGKSIGRGLVVDITALLLVSPVSARALIK